MLVFWDERRRLLLPVVRCTRAPRGHTLKGVQLANLAADALDDIVAAAERGIQPIRATHRLAHWFPRHCGLSLW